MTNYDHEKGTSGTQADELEADCGRKMCFHGFIVNVLNTGV